jgi:hypothetical protein
METIYKHAGLPQSTLDMIPVVINSCPVCREWAAAGPEPVASLRLVVQINEEVEADIMFYKKLIVWNMVDRADRWHACHLLADKSAPSLQDAISQCWIKIWGPPTFLIIDGEGGAHDEETVKWLQGQGCTVRRIAKGKKARIVEKRQHLFRESLHRAETQLIREGITCSPDVLLAQCTFAGNALINVGGATPYQARVGRQPQFLPDILAPPEDADYLKGRFSHRIREVALKSMIEETAISRIQRAGKTLTKPSGEEQGYKVGDKIDWCGDKHAKDKSRWSTEPATITRVDNSAGSVTAVSAGGHEISYDFSRIRHTMLYAACAWEDPTFACEECEFVCQTWSTMDITAHPTQSHSRLSTSTLKHIPRW